MRQYLAFFSVVSLAFAGTASAYVQRGDMDIELLGGWAIENAEDASNGDAVLSGATGDDYDGWLVSGGLGRFTSDHLQIAIVGFGAWLGGDSVKASVPVIEGFGGFNDVFDLNVDATVYGVGGRLRWHFAPANRLNPYLGVQALWADASVDVSGTVALVDDTGRTVLGPVAVSESDSADGILWGPVLGLRYELTARNDLLVEYQYHRWEGDIGDLLQDGHALFIGISHQLNY
jgi:hypothetical protein